VKLEKQIFEQKDWVNFVVETKDGHAIVWAAHYVSAPNFGWMEIGYAITLEQRTEVYGTEIIRILTDYLFVTRELGRIQMVATKSNIASLRVLESRIHEGRDVASALWDGNGQ
jgi:RimJ/RimL family protein N-acetyltransferase